jgi:hypothetical protein
MPRALLVNLISTTLTITIWHSGHENFLFLNIYNPPQETYKAPELQSTDYMKTIIAGDCNGHSPAWGYAYYKSTGKEVEDRSPI